jgi:hypothetical protein
MVRIHARQLLQAEGLTQARLRSENRLCLEFWPSCKSLQISQGVAYFSCPEQRVPEFRGEKPKVVRVI